jgi:hypothetical protein
LLRQTIKEKRQKSGFSDASVFSVGNLAVFKDGKGIKEVMPISDGY